MAKEYEYHVFQPITTAQYQESFYKAIGQNWALLTSGTKDKANTMTVSWGGVGVLWNKDVVFVFVRNSRYTKELLDSSGVFSLSFLDHEAYSREYKYLGAASGRNEDKIAAARLHVAAKLGVPYIDEAATVILCTSLFKQELTTDAAHFLAPGLDEKFYADKDYHNLYVGEVVKIMCR
jgi:flavin reductase (DIM6/NTAB) family NADH-FMN oxidoreductase RutF